MRYGANHPADLVTRAAEHGMTALALTDRDGLYGAVKFALACRSAGVRPIFGLDLAIAPALDTSLPPALAAVIGEPSGVPPRMRTPGTQGRHAGQGGRRVPARGGASVDPRLPRVTFLACDGAGWKSLCRLTSATHLRGTRGEPVSSLAMAAEHATGLIALLGPDSPVGRALVTGRPDLAVAHLDAWRAAFGPGRLVLEVVHHRGRGDRQRAQALLRFAAEQEVPVVLSNAVRYVDPSMRPPPTCSTPPAGWYRWTRGTSTGGPPRAISSRARRWPRWPTTWSAPTAMRGCGCSNAPLGSPSSARSTCGRTSASAASAIPSSTWSPHAPSGASTRHRCSGLAARPAWAGAGRRRQSGCGSGWTKN